MVLGINASTTLSGLLFVGSRRSSSTTLSFTTILYLLLLLIWVIRIIARSLWTTMRFVPLVVITCFHFLGGPITLKCRWRHLDTIALGLGNLCFVLVASSLLGILLFLTFLVVDWYFNFLILFFRISFIVAWSFALLMLCCLSGILLFCLLISVLYGSSVLRSSVPTIILLIIICFCKL